MLTGCSVTGQGPGAGLPGQAGGGARPGGAGERGSGPAGGERAPLPAWRATAASSPGGGATGGALRRQTGEQMLSVIQGRKPQVELRQSISNPLNLGTVCFVIHPQRCVHPGEVVDPDVIWCNVSVWYQ